MSSTDKSSFSNSRKIASWNLLYSKLSNVKFNFIHFIQRGDIMNKQLTLLAAAALSCAGAAQAQNSVSIYGALDAGVLNTSTTAGALYTPSADTGKLTGIKDGGIGGSNIGLKGERDMGNGNKAYFQLQGNIKLNDGAFGGANSAGTTTNFNQMALVGLSGKAGDVKIGRQVSPMYFAMASTDARGARYFGSTLTTLVGMNSATKAWNGTGNAMFGTVYNDNSITYTAPKFANTTVSLQHVFGNVNGNSGANSQDAVTAVYSDGGLRLSGLYYNGKGNGNSTMSLAAPYGGLGSPAAANTAGFTNSANTNRLTSLGALYTTGPWTMSVATFDGKNPDNVMTTGGTTHMTATALGLAYKLNADIMISGGYYDIKDKTNVGNKANQTAISLDYTMFKDTIVYVQAASTSNTGSNMNLSPIFGTPVAAGKNNTATMVGVRYTF
jgi:predicted porin